MRSLTLKAPMFIAKSHKRAWVFKASPFFS